jgi:hypothetical protein
MKLTPFKFFITPEYQQILNKCTHADDETIIKVQEIKSKSAYYFGEIKQVPSSKVSTKNIKI